VWTLLAVATLPALFVALSMPSKAAPAVAWSSDDVEYTQDICRHRAEGAFAREGWTNIHPSGTPALAVAAFKGLLVAVILCVDRAIGANHSVAVIFVAGGENGQPDAERDRLQYYMRD